MSRMFRQVSPLLHHLWWLKMTLTVRRATNGRRQHWGGTGRKRGGRADVDRTCRPYSAPQRHHNDRCQRCTQVKRMWWQGHISLDLKKHTHTHTVEERLPWPLHVLFRTFADDVADWILNNNSDDHAWASGQLSVWASFSPFLNIYFLRGLPLIYESWPLLRNCCAASGL